MPRVFTREAVVSTKYVLKYEVLGEPLTQEQHDLLWETLSSQPADGVTRYVFGGYVPVLLTRGNFAWRLDDWYDFGDAHTHTVLCELTAHLLRK